MVANLGHAGSCVILFFNFILKSKIKKCQNLINFSKNTCRFRRRFWIEHQGRKIIQKTSWATSLTCLLYDVILYQIQHIFFKFNQKHQILMTINIQQMETKPTTESKQLKIQIKFTVNMRSKINLTHVIVSENSFVPRIWSVVRRAMVQRTTLNRNVFNLATS